MGLRRKARERAIQALFQLDSMGFPSLAEPLRAEVKASPAIASAPMGESALPEQPAQRPPDLLWSLSAGATAKVRRRAPGPAVVAPTVATEAPEPRGANLEDALEAFWGSFDPPEPDIQAQADPLIRGVLEHLVELDRTVEACSLHWRVDRMARVDRNILRLGVYELLHRPEVPKKVCLNEAIEIASRYGSEESSAFINGVLDRVAQSSRPDEKELDAAGDPAGTES